MGLNEIRGSSANQLNWAILFDEKTVFCPLMLTIHQYSDKAF